MAIKKWILVSLTILLAFPFTIGLTPSAVRALNGVPVTDSSNTFSRSGPNIQHLLVNFYSGTDQELQDFELGHLDLADSGPNGVPLSRWASYAANPDFVLSPVQGEFGFSGIYFNMMSYRFKVWGCDWANGNSKCGLDMREAFAHLIDRQSLVTDGPLQGAGVAIVDPSPPAEVPSGSPLSVQCSWDTLPQYHNNCNSAFHVGPPCKGGFCTDPSEPDYCAAVSYLVQANVDSGGALGLVRDFAGPLDQFGNVCSIAPGSGGLANIASHPMLMMIRDDDDSLLYMGAEFMLAVNTLFTGSAVSSISVSTPTFGHPANFAPIVLDDGRRGGTANWDSYTYQYNFPGPFPDQMYSLYNSRFASNFCGGPQAYAPSNPTFDCIASLDNDTRAAAQATDTPTFNAATLRAFNDFGSHALDLPAFSPGLRTVALRSVAGLVNEDGFGYPTFWTLLDGRRNSSYAPVNPLFAFGGGDLDRLRLGLNSGTSELNPFNAASPSELLVLYEVYDTLFRASPVEPGNVRDWMCGAHQVVVDSNGDTHVLVCLPPLRFHDDIPVTASDVKFSLLNLRDFSSGFRNYLAFLKTVNIISPVTLDIVMKGQSLLNLWNLSRIPIIPEHLWELPGDKTYGDVGIVDPAKLSLSYDPIAAKTLIGSGPFACVDQSSGQVGGGCARSASGSPAGQTISPGGTLLLTKFDFTSTFPDPLDRYIGLLPASSLRCSITRPVSVSEFFTDAGFNPLPSDKNGNPRVDVVLAHGIVRSTNPGEIIVWVNVTNTDGPLQSLKVNETLSVDWSVSPAWIPTKGAIHVYYANTTSLLTNPEITDPKTISVTTGNPEAALLAIPSLNNTAIGHPLLSSQSILLAVKLDYGLDGTSQSASSYPRNYTGVAGAVAWSQPSYAGNDFTGTVSGLFVAYSKVLGDANGDGKVNIVDLALVGRAFGSRPGDANWNSAADLNGDGIVSIVDLALVGEYFGS